MDIAGTEIEDWEVIPFELHQIIHVLCFLLII